MPSLVRLVQPYRLVDLLFFLDGLVLSGLVGISHFDDYIIS